jgi:hypothetical protein
VCLFWDEVRVVGGCAHQAVRLCMYASGWGHARQATTRRPTTQLYASSRLGRYVSGDTFAMARLG